MPSRRQVNCSKCKSFLHLTKDHKEDEFEEYKGVLMLMQDQTNEKKCLEVLRRYKAQILKEERQRIKDNISKGVKRSYKRKAEWKQKQLSKESKK